MCKNYYGMIENKIRLPLWKQQQQHTQTHTQKYKFYS